MNKQTLTRAERSMYQLLIYSNFIFVFIWMVKIIVIGRPGGDDGGGGI